MNQNNIQGARPVSAEEVARVDGVPQGVPLTKEELQKTQVLNLKEFAEAVRFEKITSKKPAIIIAIIGALLIVLGSGFQVVKSLNVGKEPTVEPRNAPVQEPEDEIGPSTTQTSMTCRLQTPNNPDGTDVDYTILFDFDNQKLIGFTKSYSVTPTAGATNGAETIQKGLADFQTVVTQIDGFQSTVTETTNGYIASATVDYLKLDLTQYPENLQGNFLTKLDFALDTELSHIEQSMSHFGFTCE